MMCLATSSIEYPSKSTFAAVQVILIEFDVLLLISSPKQNYYNEKTEPALFDKCNIINRICSINSKYSMTNQCLPFTIDGSANYLWDYLKQCKLFGPPCLAFCK